MNNSLTRLLSGAWGCLLARKNWRTIVLFQGARAQVSSSELERLQAIKHSMNRLLNRVGKVKQELEHILDDDADMLVRVWPGFMTVRQTCSRRFIALGANRQHSLR